MENNKLRVLLDFKKLTPELQEQVKLAYTTGMGDYLVNFTNSKGQKVVALRFETEEKIYLIRMSEEMAVSLMEDDGADDDDIEFSSSSIENFDGIQPDIESMFEGEIFA